MKSKVIHQFWMGKQIPQDYVAYGNEWLALNPGWELKVWDLESFKPEYNLDLISDLYKRDDGRNGVELFVQLADFVSYEILHRYGGVYVNVDIQPVRSLAYMYERWDGLAERAWAPWEDAHKLVNCALGAPSPRHEFFAACMQTANELYWAQPGGAMTDTTGPACVTRTVFQGGHEFYGLPLKTFNAVHWGLVPPGGDASGLYEWQKDPDVIGIHHWGHKKSGRSNYVETATQ